MSIMVFLVAFLSQTIMKNYDQLRYLTMNCLHYLKNLNW